MNIPNALATLTPELEQRLKACSNFLSPPRMAVELIQVANDFNADFTSIANILKQDPAICTKILRMANSPFYANQKGAATLEQTTLIIGLNGLLSMALSFTLVKSLHGTPSQSLDYSLFWNRAFLAASISRAISEVCQQKNREELVMASLIQDIGMLALDHIFPDLYADSHLDQTIHTHVIEHEQKKLGTDHAVVGGWVLATWQLPASLHMAVTASDDPNPMHASPCEQGQFSSCVALSSLIAGLYLRRADKADFLETSDKANTWLGITHENFIRILVKAEQHISDTGNSFDFDIHTAIAPEIIMERASEILLFRQIYAYHRLEALQQETTMLQSRCQHLEDISHRDALTGVLSRTYFEEILETAFQTASGNNTPLSLIFADIDRFKSINDTYGHQVGDLVLKTAANILNAQLRVSDLIGRYGGEEFIIVIPGGNNAVAQTICNRMITAFNTTSHEVGLEHPLQITTSLGVATLEDRQTFATAQELVNAADRALYMAKSHGRACWRAHVTPLATP